MELKLHVYEGKEIIKTYTADTIDFSFGVVEDVLDALDFEHMDDKMHIAGMVVKASKSLRPFLKDIFNGVTDEEIKTVKMSNIIEIFKGLYNYASKELGMVASDSGKN